MPYVRRVEIHFHLLPQVDDGPKTMDEAIELARAAVADGTSDVVTTPHVNQADPAALPQLVEELSRALRREDVPLRVHRGGELHSDDVPGLGDADLEHLAVGPAGARWVLLEAPLQGPADALEPAAAELRARGYGVVLAHPERSPGLHELGTEEVLHRECALGSGVQLNATSLLGHHGDEARESALELVRAGLASAVSSDAHRLERGPVLTPAFAELARTCGEEAARGLVDAGPRALLVRGITPVAGPERARRSQAGL